MADISVNNTTTQLSGKTVLVTENDQTVTGLQTFDRDPSAPFAVTASSAVVTNLDADKLDGQEGAAYATLVGAEVLTNKTLTNPTVNAGSGTIVLPNTAAPAQTAEGSIVWDSDDDLLTVGDGASRKTMVDTAKAQTLTNKTLAGATVTGDVLFTDATYDIGKSAATRPRDLFLSRNEVVGGTLGVTGVATFTAQSVHTQGVDLSTGGRVQFPAVQNPTVNANCLDDYAEGTWTPVIGGSGGTSGQTYTSQVGSYIKIGKFVWATFNISLSAKGTITTSVEIQGLPFTAENTGALNPVGAVQWSALATTWVNLITLVLPNTTVARVRGTTVAATANATELTTADIGATTVLAGTILYRASA